MAKIAAGAAATVPAAPCATSASRWPHGGWIGIVHGKDVGVSSRFLAELAQQLGASIRIPGGVTLISSEVWFCCPLWADRKGLQWRLVLPHSASAFPQRLLQTGQSAPGQMISLCVKQRPGMVKVFRTGCFARLRHDACNEDLLV